MSILNFITASMFGSAEFLGINIGFWIAIGISVLITIIQNLWFWTRKKYVMSEDKVEKIQEINEVDNDEEN